MIMQNQSLSDLEKQISDHISKAPPLNDRNFEHNNWMKLEAIDNIILQKIYKKGGALWLDKSGDLCFRRHYDLEVQILEKGKAKMLLASFLNMKSIQLFSIPKDGSADIITPDELHIVSERFTPFVNQEFYPLDNMIYRTAWKPTFYMLITSSSTQPKTILTLIDRLCNRNEDHRTWVINWLAGFFQSLKRSQVALVLKGAQGSGKGIFFNQVIAPLFGETYCVTADDGRLNSTFKNWIAGKLFYNLNEISHDKRTRTLVKNFIKQLVTDDTVQTELKYKDAQAIEIFGMVLITSNELAPLEIEPNDRRFTVIQTAGSMREDGIDPEEFIKAIKSELEIFAAYLKGYKVDWNLYHKALDTDAKRAVVHATTDKVTLLADAFRRKDLSFFETFREKRFDLYQIIEKAFEMGRIRRTKMKDIYDAFYDDDIKKSFLYTRLSACDAVIFGKTHLWDGYDTYKF